MNAQLSWKDFLVAQGARIRADQVTEFGPADSPAREERARIVPLLHFGVVGVSGADAEAFLQAQLTCDVGEVGAETARFGGYCNPKGRLIATFLILRAADRYLMVLPHAMAGVLAERLRKYVLRSKVGIDDLSDQAPLLGIVGKAWTEVLAAANLDPAPRQTLACVRGRAASLVALPQDCALVIAAARDAPALWRTLAQVAPPAGAAAWDWQQLRAGIAMVVPATQEAFLPQMLDLDRLGGVSYRKGCYPGQEIVARTHYLGEVKRGLALLHSEAAAAPGDELLVTESGEAAGVVASAAAAPTGGWDLLAVVRRDLPRRAMLRLKDAGGAGVSFLEPQGSPVSSTAQ